jgi:eukaryotic-like serine/threonine-protein kinase
LSVRGCAPEVRARGELFLGPKPMALRIASQAEPIPGYKLIERLGGGGFGEVWKAVAPGGLFKAIKFVYGDLHSSSEEGQRAEQELKALSRIKTVRHPYILSLERYDILEGQLVIIMELADRNLYDRLKDCKATGLPGIPREELLRYMEETAEALDLMNIEYQLQHLDVKPQNIFLVHNHVKVADFGLVKDLAGMMASLTGGVTPVYAAPETFDGWVSRFSDQYSLAIVYEELLTGVRPFTSSSVAQLIQQHLKSAPNLSPLPPCDREAIGRSLAKNPDDRFGSCLELVRALRSAGQELSRPLRPSPHTARPGPVLPPFAPAEPGGDSRPAGAFDTNADQAAQQRESTGNTQWLQAETGDDKVPENRLNLPPARQDQEGSGSLCPALVIGLGGLGLGVLRRLTERLHERFEELKPPDCIRQLYIDTDPDASRLATQGDPDSALSPNEIVQARLNRPSHYLRSVGGKTRAGTWFDHKMVYRIPRTLVTTGLRVLGRLAFFDNYKLITRRLQTELEACHDSSHVVEEATRSGLGLRTTRPRVYVVCGLAGGSGSGMFLDLAYVLRRMLRQQGHEHPEIVGIFLTPPVDRHPGRTLGMGNTFAALTELNHFSAPGTVFSAIYDEREKAFNDHDPPFARCILLQLPDDSENRSIREVTSLAADYLYRNLVTPLGRAADDTRDRISVLPRQPWGLVYQTFGTYRVSMPRQALFQRLARYLCLQLLERWLSKDAKPIKEEIARRVAEEWTRREFTPEKMIEMLQQTAASVLGKATDAAFNEITDPLASLDASQVEPAREALRAAFAQLEAILGKTDENVSMAMGKLAEPLTVSADEMANAWGLKLAAFTANLIEQPEFRLAGAEEAIRELLATIEGVISQYDPLLRDISRRALEARARILALIEGLSSAAPSRKNPTVLPNLIELIRAYPRWRLQSMILQRVGAAYVSMRGWLSDQMREMNYCRDRLVEMKRVFHDVPTETQLLTDTVLVRALFPEGCRTLSDTVETLRTRFTAEHLRELDERMQQTIQEDFTALVQVCLGSTNRLKELERAMERRATEFVVAHVPDARIADIYLAQYEKEEQVGQDLANMFAEAAPKLAGPRPQGSEIAILALPPGQASDKIRYQAQRAIPDADLVEALSGDDIVFYRELFQMPLSELDQLGPLGYEAYRQVGTVEHFTPHSRTDIVQWRAASVS